MERAKPHPQVYLNCASDLKVQPQDCLVFEDSVPGVMSAKSANMKVVAVPETQEKPERFKFADIILKDLEYVGTSTVNTLLYKKR
eukprot:UN09683